uniref:Uncharacterized protein n=1 Tax=Arion vulgaris TaxID=1028688 RepID=A0A0B7AUY9_9EUPU
MIRPHGQIANRQCISKNNATLIQWMQSKGLSTQKVELRNNKIRLKKPLFIKCTQRPVL